MRINTLARALVLVLFTGLAAASCNPDKSPTAPHVSQVSAQDPALLGDALGGVNRLLGTLLTCRPLPFDADSAVIGPLGGTLHMGPHSLFIPPGALNHRVMIKGEAPTDDVNSVRFSPEGLQFERSATLTMSYANCNLVGGLLTPKRIAYTTEGLHILSYIPSVDNLLQRDVTGRLDHFSRYAVGW